MLRPGTINNRLHRFSSSLGFFPSLLSSVLAQVGCEVQYSVFHKQGEGEIAKDVSGFNGVTLSVETEFQAVVNSYW